MKRRTPMNPEDFAASGWVKKAQDPQEEQRIRSSFPRWIANVQNFDLINKGRQLWEYLNSGRCSLTDRVLVLGALLYLISPIDAIPDVIPVVGWLDDIGVATAVLAFLNNKISECGGSGKALHWQKRQFEKLSKPLRQIRTTFEEPSERRQVMAEELRDMQNDQAKLGDPETQGQGGASEMLRKGVAATNQFLESLQIPTKTAGTLVGTILGCLTVKAFTKAWPRLETPVNAAGYVVGGYAAYRLVKAAFGQGTGNKSLEADSPAECDRAWVGPVSSGPQRGVLHGGPKR
jgi:uncharacterized membrane protein YkvA (DUF1232 family)